MGLLVTALGGIATTYSMWSSYEGTAAAQRTLDMQRTENFTIFRTQTNDKLGYQQDQINFLMHRQEITEQECRK